MTVRTPIGADEFEVLFRATAEDLFGYLRRRTNSDGEDLVAETYAIAWRKRAGMPAPAFRRAWLFGIARNLLREAARNQETHEKLLEALERSPILSETDAVSDGRSAAVFAALERLPPADREILELAHWERLTSAELAIALGIRPGAARVRLHRARLALAADRDLQALLEAAIPTT